MDNEWRRVRVGVEGRGWAATGLLALAVAAGALAGTTERNEGYWDSVVNLHIDNHGRLVGKGRTADEIAALLKTLPVDIVQVSAYGADGAMTTYPSRLLSRPDLDGWDTLAVWGEAARKAGKRFHVYINTRGLGITKKRPDWMQVDAAGKGKGRNDGLDACPRPSADGSGYLEALLLPLLEEIMTGYRPDGIWVDGDHARTRTCHCRTCRAAWTAATGKAAPPADPEDPDWPRWLALEQERYDEYRRRMAEVVHRVNPKAFYTSNHSWKKITTIFEKDDPRGAPDFADTLSADLSHGRALGITRSKALFLSAERDTPWDIMHLVYKPDEISRQRVLQQGAVTIAHGGSWFLWTPGSDPLAPEPFARSMDCARFVRDRAAALGRSESVNPVAVLVGETAWREERTGGRAGFADLVAPQAWAVALEDACLGTDLLNEADLAHGLDRYRVVVVPNQRRLAPAALDRLRRFADAGGTLVLAGATLDGAETDREGFAALAGADRGAPTGGVFQARAVGAFVAESRWPVAARDATVLAGWDDGRPLATARPQGAGRVVYVAVGAPAMPDHDGFAARLLGLCGIGPSVRMSGPGRAEQFIFTFRRRGDATVVHLADVGSRVKGVRTVEETTQRIDDTPPVPEVTLHLPLPGPVPVSVVPASTTVTHGWTNGILTATLRNVAVHAALILGATPATPLALLPADVPLADRHPLSRIRRADGIEEDFELAGRGQAVTLPAAFNLRSQGRTSVGISAAAAAGGKQSLEFVDAPCDTPFLPMLTLDPRIVGPLVFRCDLRIEKGATVTLEFRTKENRREFPVGPSLTFHAKTGKVSAGRKEIADVPVGAWFGVEVRLAADGRAAYDLVLRPAGHPAATFRDLPCESPQFAKCGWIGIIGAGNVPGRFFIDNLEIRGVRSAVASPL